MLSLIKIFSKLIRIKIPNRLQLLQNGGIRRDRQSDHFYNNRSYNIIIRIGKWSSFNTKQIAVFARKTAFYSRTANRAENRLIFLVVWVRVRVCAFINVLLYTARTAFAKEKFITKWNRLVYTERARNLVRAENRADCLQSEISGDVHDRFFVQPISALNLYAYVTMYTTVRRSTNTLANK